MQNIAVLDALSPVGCKVLQQPFDVALHRHEKS